MKKKLLPAEICCVGEADCAGIFGHILFFFRNIPFVGIYLREKGIGR
ncbi:MAG: hypothetical protein U5L72_14565 [Bacteroidales bacterium]|nr:hypothetical protein [Bacteroidales bacterium]